MTFKKKWKLYKLISQNPDLCSQALAYKLEWDIFKVHHHLLKLVREGLIEDSYHAKDVGDLINWDEMIHTTRE